MGVSKKVVYTLFSIILVLAMFIGYSLYKKYNDDKYSEEKISSIISKFEQKFKNDSIYLAKANKLFIDKLSQHIIDSVSIAYETKLTFALSDVEKYKELLRKNNIPFEETKRESVVRNYKMPNNNVKYSDIYPDGKLDNNKEPEFKDVVDVDNSKNEDYNTILANRAKANIQENEFTKNENDSGEEDYNTILARRAKNKEKRTQENQSNEINKSSENEDLYADNVSFRKGHLTHDNYILDSAENFSDLQTSPVLKGCENKLTEYEKKNCFAVKVFNQVRDTFNAQIIHNSSNLKKGMHKVRILFVIDEQGNSHIGKLVGEWPYEVYDVAKNAIKSIPEMTPGRKANKSVPVKYSLRIPFNVD